MPEASRDSVGPDGPMQTPRYMPHVRARNCRTRHPEPRNIAQRSRLEYGTAKTRLHLPGFNTRPAKQAARDTSRRATGSAQTRSCEIIPMSSANARGRASGVSADSRHLKIEPAALACRALESGQPCSTPRAMQSPKVPPPSRTHAYVS
eukprot:8054767-Pyramimonas_sp.AAC.1